jgi:hypothetical protein
MPKTGGRIHSSDIRKFRAIASDQEKERIDEVSGASSLDTRKPPAKTGRTADFS